MENEEIIWNKVFGLFQEAEKEQSQKKPKNAKQIYVKGQELQMKQLKQEKDEKKRIKIGSLINIHLNRAEIIDAISKNYNNNNKRRTNTIQVKPINQPKINIISKKYNEYNKNSIDSELYQIVNDLIINYDELHDDFNNIVGQDDIKTVFKEMILLSIRRPTQFVGLRQPINGFLLYGPPGNGKTFLVKALAKEAKCTFFSISSSSITSKNFGEAEKIVRTLFIVANKQSPSIIFIDEADALFTKRGQMNEHEASRRLKTEFLIQIDGLTHHSTKNGFIFVILSTNMPTSLDDAILRRLPKKLYISPPDFTMRKCLLNDLLQKNQQGHILSTNEINTIAKMTHGYSNSDINALCKDASYGPLREIGFKNLYSNYPITTLRPIMYKDLLQSIDNIIPSLTPQDIKKYKEFENQWN